MNVRPPFPRGKASAPLTHLRSGGFRSALALVLGLSTVLSTPGGSGAQLTPEGPSILSLLDPGSRTLEVGQAVDGSLGPGDFVTTVGRVVQAWSLTGEAGDSLWIELRSEEMDGYLYLIGPGIPYLLEDDDGAGACNARIGFQVLSRLPHLVVVSGSMGQPGRYTLEVTREPRPLDPRPCNPGAPPPPPLDQLETAGRTLTQEGSWDGQLSDQDTVLAGQRLQAWELTGREGDHLSLDVASTDFDPVLWILAPGMAGPYFDDDGAGQCNAHVELDLPASGTVRVVVGGYSADARGAFQLYAGGAAGLPREGVCGPPQEAMEWLDALDPGDRVLRIGDEAPGTLSEVDPIGPGGAPVQAWRFQGVEGERVTIDMVSSDFDAYLTLVGPGLVLPVTDDDGAGNCNARIQLQLPASGDYIVVARALFTPGTGAFTLFVSREPGPARPGVCGQPSG